MERGIAQRAQWCGTRDMTAGGHTTESGDRDMLLQVVGGNAIRQAWLKTTHSIQGWPDKIV
eukprot:5005299-Pyramimonas_sp.AAC.1